MCTCEHKVVYILEAAYGKIALQFSLHSYYINQRIAFLPHLVRNLPLALFTLIKFLCPLEARDSCVDASRPEQTKYAIATHTVFDLIAVLFKTFDAMKLKMFTTMYIHKKMYIFSTLNVVAIEKKTFILCALSIYASTYEMWQIYVVWFHLISL